MQATGFMNMQTPVISNTMGLGGAMNLNSSLAQFTQMQGLQGQMLNNSLQQQVMYQGMQVPQPMNLGLAITPNSNPQIQVPTQTQNMAQTIQLSQLQKQDIQTQLHAFGPTLQKIDVLFAGLQGDNKEGVELFMQRVAISNLEKDTSRSVYWCSDRIVFHEPRTV